MAEAAIGIRPRSGWAMAVVVAAPPGWEVLVRRRIEVVREGDPARPWHEAQSLGLAPDEADALDEQVFTGARAVAGPAVAELVAEVAALGHEVRAAGIVGEPQDLPPAEQILRSHPMLHAAEDELYRSALTCAAAEAGVPVTCFHPKALPQAGYAELLARLGKAAGRPWNADVRLATVVALEALTATAGSVGTGASG